MTGSQLAALIDASQGQVSKMERNKVAITEAQQHRLAMVFAVSVPWLMGAE